MPVKSYADLDVWRASMDLVASIYDISSHFPDRELFGLTAQLRRAAVSVPSNIAEGQGRKSTPEFRRHLSIALGSLNEVETCLRIAERLGYLHAERSQALLGECAEIGRMTNGLHRALATSGRGP